MLGLLAVVGVSCIAQVQTATLSNGMRVAIEEDYRSPRFGIAVAYKGGAYDVPTDRAELAHFTEHLTFRAQSLSFQQAEGRAARYNGSTFATETVYYAIDDLRYIEWWLAVERRRLTSLPLESETFSIERQVVARELQQRTTYAILLSEAAESRLLAPMQRSPTIATRTAQLTQLTAEDVTWFHRVHYRPTNAALFIVAPMPRRRTLALVKKYFDGLKDGIPPAAPKAKAVTRCPPGHIRIVSGYKADRVYVYVQLPPTFDPWAAKVLGSILNERMRKASRNSRTGASAYFSLSTVGPGPRLRFELTPQLRIPSPTLAEDMRRLYRGLFDPPPEQARLEQVVRDVRARSTLRNVNRFDWLRHVVRRVLHGHRVNAPPAESVASTDFLPLWRQATRAPWIVVSHTPALNPEGFQVEGAPACGE